MTQVFNVYCDESCHLEHDRQKVMVLGESAGEDRHGGGGESPLRSKA